MHSLAQYWNTDQLAKAGLQAPPATKEEFDQAVAKIKSGGLQNPFWIPSLWPAHLIFYSLIWQNGGAPYSEDGQTATFNSAEGVEALTWMVDQIKNGVSPRNVAIDTQYNAFKSGRERRHVRRDLADQRPQVDRAEAQVGDGAGPAGLRRSRRCGPTGTTSC